MPGKGLWAANGLGLLHDLLPNASTVAILINPTNPNAEPDAKALQEAALSLGMTTKVISARNEREIDAFFATLVREHIPASSLCPTSCLMHGASRSRRWRLYEQSRI